MTTYIGSYPKNLIIWIFLNFISKNLVNLSQFFPWKILCLSQKIIFFSSKFDEISPTKKNKNFSFPCPSFAFQFCKTCGRGCFFSLVIWCQWETIGPCKAEDANSLNQSRDCPNAQASQAGVIILYMKTFSHQNVYEYIGLMFMHTCIRFMFMQWINKREKKK